MLTAYIYILIEPSEFMNFIEIKAFYALFNKSI